MNIYENFGRLMEQYEAECESHIQTVGVLRALTTGELKLEALTVTDDNKWHIDGIPVTVTVLDPEEAPAN